MASKALAKPMLRGIVKAVPSGDTLVIMELGNTTSEIPPERTIILSSIMAPRLVNTTLIVTPLIVIFSSRFLFPTWIYQNELNWLDVIFLLVYSLLIFVSFFLYL